MEQNGMAQNEKIGSAAGSGGRLPEHHERPRRRVLRHQAAAPCRSVTWLDTELTSLLFVFALVGALVGPVGTSYAVEESSPQKGAEPTQYYVEDIKAAVKKHIESTLDAEGTFHIRDDKTGERLQLRFVTVHDPVRQIGGDVYFACTDFHVLGEPEKLYDVDFWMRGDTGELKVYQTKIHKEPRWSFIYGWYKQPRYTFVDDRIKYLY